MRPSVEATAARATITILLLLGVVYACWLCRSLMADLFIALMLASAVSPVVDKAQGKGVPRWVTVICTYLIVIGLYAAMAYAISGPITEQAKVFFEKLPQYIESVNGAYNQLLAYAGDKVDLHVRASDFKSVGVATAHRMLDLSSGFLGILLHVVLIVFLAAYFAANADQLWPKLLSWMSPANRKEIQSLIEPVSQRMGGYVRGQLLVATAVAIFFATGFSLIGLNYALVLGCLAGVLNLVPYVGSFIATILAVLVASNQSVTMVVLTIVVFMVEQTVESNFFVPFLLGRQIDLHPLIVLFAVLIGATLGGIAGVFIFVPLVSAAIYLGNRYFVAEER